MNYFAAGILIPEGVRSMSMKAIAASMGIGAAAGAVAVLMMPRNNPTRQLAEKTAEKVEQAATQVGNKLNQTLDM